MDYPKRFELSMNDLQCKKALKYRQRKLNCD